MIFKKRVLNPGKYLIQTPSGERLMEEITPERIAGWADRFTKMLDAGLKIPAPWRHDLSVPLSKATKSSKDNAGWWKSATVAEDGGLDMELDIPRKEDADKIGTTVQEVSPYIRSWDDGNGNHWEDSILHVALVTHPVIPGQSNFIPSVHDEQPALALCLGMMLSTDLELAHKMSMNEIMDSARKALCPAGCANLPFDETPWLEDVYEDHIVYRKGDKFFRTSYKVESGVITLSGEPKEVLRQVDYKVKKEGLAMAVDMKNPDDGGTTTSPTNASGSGIKEALAALKLVGLTLPDDTTAENMIERIVIAAGAISGTKEGEDDDENKDPNDPKNKGKVKEQPAPIAMSQELNTGVETVSKEMLYASKLAAGELVRRVDTLVSTGRITPAYATKTLKPMLEGFELALGEDGEPAKTSFEVILEGLEALPENKSLLDTKPITSRSSKTDKQGLRLAHEEELPQDMMGTPELTEERINEVLAEQYKNSGRPVPVMA